MKPIYTLLVVFSTLVGTSLFAQGPIKWEFTAKRLSATKYEVLLTASINEGWHLYSQTQPEGAIAFPTAIEFRKNPLIKFAGVPKEKGELKKIKEEMLGFDSWQYSGEVSFVQVIKVKNNVKTNVAGSVVFQACTDEKCLPQKKVDFSIALAE